MLKFDNFETAESFSGSDHRATTHSSTVNTFIIPMTTGVNSPATEIAIFYIPASVVVIVCVVPPLPPIQSTPASSPCPQSLTPQPLKKQ